MTFVQAIAAIRGTIEGIQKAIDARNSAAIAEAKLALLSQLLDLHQEVAKFDDQKTALEAEAAGLREELRNLKDFRADIADNYERFTSSLGGTVYRTKNHVPGSGGLEYLCANCATEGKKTYLSPTPMGRTFNCPAGHGTTRI